MRPRYDLLYANYPRTSTKREELYNSLGWSSLVNAPQYHNTCAIRMSVACIKSGITFSKGGLIIQAGPLKGQRLEPSQTKLSEMLETMWGKAEKFDDHDFLESKIGKRRGVISFFRIDRTSNQGHIDMVEPLGDFHSCIMSIGCYFSSSRIWFWELP